MCICVFEKENEEGKRETEIVYDEGKHIWKKEEKRDFSS